MTDISGSRRWGIRAVAAAKVAGSMARQNRWLRASATGARVFLDSASRVAHLLWLEVTGLFFVLFCVVGASAAWREYHRHKVLSGKLLAAICFSIVFGWFGFTSFWRARRK